MTAPLRWGFLGASRIGRSALAPAVLAAGQVLQAAAAREVARAAAFCAAFGGGRAYGDYAGLLADPSVDAVYIALPNDLHLPWTLQALAAGKHVLCEKPLGLDRAEVVQMAEAASHSGLVVMEAFCHRFHPQFERARTLLSDGAIGRVLAAQTHFVGSIADPADFRWDAARGGGALYDLGCYGVSLLRSLLDREPLSAACTAARRGAVDAGFAAQLDFGLGCVGQVVCSFEGVRQQGLVLFGSEGGLSIDWPYSTKGRETVLVCRGETERFPATDPYRIMVEHFAGAVAGRHALRHGLSDSVRQAASLDLMFAAAGMGRTSNGRATNPGDAR